MDMSTQMQQEPKREHSPLPWSLRDGGTGWLQIMDAQGHDIIDVNYSDGADEPELFPEGANAAFVLRAVNNHAALYEAVSTLLSAMEMQEGREKEELHILQREARHIWDEAKAKARAALALVDGPQTKETT